MASTEDLTALNTAGRVIDILKQPDKSQLTEMRHHEILPPTDVPIVRGESQHALRMIYCRMLPNEWDNFRTAYCRDAVIGELTTRLSFICTLAQLGRVLVTESVEPGYDRAVEASVMTLEFNLDRLTEPISPDRFAAPYEGNVVPAYDAISAISALDSSTSWKIDPYFDTVLVNTVHFATQLCIQQDVDFELG